MKQIEFYTAPDGKIMAMTEGRVEEITQKNCELINQLVDAVETHYPEAYAALRRLYKKSAANARFYQYKIACRFIRCNLGEMDTLKYDMVDGIINCEQVHCPLRGTGECKLENIVCMPKKGSKLTGRQFEIAELIAKGWTNKEIADKLFISIYTVRNTIMDIKERLNLKHTAQISTWYNEFKF